MGTQRKVILYIAISVDGYIARENGDIDWLLEAETQGEGDNGYAEFYKTIDTVLMGKKTYDQVLTLVDEFPYPQKKCYVFSTSESREDQYVDFVSENVVSFTRRLKQQEGTNIWLVGGAELLDTFLKEKLVDEFIITIIPIMLGKGIPLFKADNPEYKLHLKETTRYGQFVQIHYEVR
ncbi:dihydrofolate reductase family protein [Microaerobacter geothermalis]|uniref:dihydrofolate reductase family protein n=1 Tax=Microaerobacter geothermalis TaxID=674972 RepID=UPI001F45F002|nr:dihydrofolate reductase family protein [Microaerobacter geothermalis]MCF6094931.1 dihydrofolate reductase family protein [Microaerobacter geothermalis]